MLLKYTHKAGLSLHNLGKSIELSSYILKLSAWLIQDRDNNKSTVIGLVESKQKSKSVNAELRNPNTKTWSGMIGIIITFSSW